MQGTKKHFVAVASMMMAQSVFASESFSPVPFEIFEGEQAGKWERVERLRDNHPQFTQEAFPKNGEHADPLIVKWFGTSTPHSAEFLLHCFLNKGSKLPPVLLIHGAADNANRAWIHPWEAVTPKEIEPDKQGMALYLKEQGFPVCAITFAHPHGDNLMQAEQVANAIRRMRALLGSDPKVNIVAHSKGTVAARIYCSGGNNHFRQSTFLSAFRQDVADFIAIAAPLRGVDTPFRYYGYNLQVYSKDLNAPLAADKILFWGRWKDTQERTLFSDSARYYPGQAQLLFNLVRDAGVPLSLESYTIDGNKTMNALYNGGSSSFVQSRGIDAAIQDGGRLIYRLDEIGLDPSVSLAVIAGDSPYITYPLRHILIPMPWEVTAPDGDGVVPLASSVFTDNILKRGAPLLGKSVLHLNHLDVARKKEAFTLINGWLNK